MSFAIDLIAFGDGEIAGPDLGNYVIELESRKPAAEFVAKQVRMAEAENRDVVAVLTTLAEMPVGTDPSAKWSPRTLNFIQLSALACLTNAAQRDAIVRSLENMPALPEFYRRSQPRN